MKARFLITSEKEKCGMAQMGVTPGAATWALCSAAAGVQGSDLKPRHFPKE